MVDQIRCTQCALSAYSSAECEKDGADRCSRWEPDAQRIPIPRRTPLEIVTERAEDLRSALSELHDHTVYYLTSRDLDVEDLPEGSPLRLAIERARDLI